jgi:hypothetical protein
MSGSCVNTFLCDYAVNEVISNTFKLDHDGSTEKETIDVEKSGWTTIEILFNTVSSFHTMSSKMELTGPMMISYFLYKCLLIICSKNSSQICHIMMIKQSRTSSFLSKNDLLPYFLKMPSLQ